MASSPIVIGDLGNYVMPHLIEWWKTTRAEHNKFYQQIAELKSAIRNVDKQITPSKTRVGPQGTATQRLIRQRRAYHEKVKLLEDHIYMLKRQLAVFDKTFEAAIANYARARSFAITSALYTKFPRELRDMVYSYLIDGSGNPLNDQFKQQVWSPYEPQISSLPLFLDPEFVPEEVISEIMRIAARRVDLPRSKLYAFLRTSDVQLEFAAEEFFGHVRKIRFPNTVFERPSWPRTDLEKNKTAEELYGKCCRGGLLKPTCRRAIQGADEMNLDW